MARLPLPHPSQAPDPLRWKRRGETSRGHMLCKPLLTPSRPPSLAFMSQLSQCPWGTGPRLMPIHPSPHVWTAAAPRAQIPPWRWAGWSPHPGQLALTTIVQQLHMMPGPATAQQGVGQEPGPLPSHGNPGPGRSFRAPSCCPHLPPPRAQTTGAAAHFPPRALRPTEAPGPPLGHSSLSSPTSTPGPLTWPQALPGIACILP